MKKNIFQKEKILEAMAVHPNDGRGQPTEYINIYQHLAESRRPSSKLSDMSFRLLVLSMLATLAVQDAVGYQGMVGLAKKVFVPTTSVKYVIPVVTSLTTVSSTCFIAVNVTGNCRRRRWSSQQEAVILSLDDTDEFDIDTILPSLPRYRHF